jgi:hypothetical protein
LTRPDALIVGEILFAVRQRAFEGADDSVRALADRALIPRAVLQGPGGSAAHRSGRRSGAVIRPIPGAPRALRGAASRS